ncbi:hypothetical protein RCL1_002019 [Eukaryota sp. TZLM3-RCL]
MNSTIQRQLRNIQQSQEYHVTLKDGNYLKWVVEVLSLDPNSALSRSLCGQNLTFEVTFLETFPQSAPFVRIISHTVSGGSIYSNTFCVTELSDQSWNQQTDVAELLQALILFLYDNGATATSATPTMSAAKEGYRYVLNAHQWKNSAFESTVGTT